MSDNQVCPIWGTPVRTEIENPPRFRDGSYVNSPRAGGKYFIAGSFQSEVGALDDQTKAHLTSWLIEQRRFGEEWPEITPEAIAAAKQRRDLPIYECADRFLSYLRRIEPSVGQRFYMDGDETLNALAWAESRIIDPVEMDAHLSFFLSYLETRGWIEHRTNQGHRLTVEGYSRLEELEHQDTGSSQAFVAM